MGYGSITFLSLLQVPEEAQALCITQLRSLTGCARGLTVVSDPLEETFVPDHSAISQARSDSSITTTREQIVAAIESVTIRWWADAETTAVRF